MLTLIDQIEAFRVATAGRNPLSGSRPVPEPALRAWQEEIARMAGEITRLENIVAALP